ncbi:MAG: single-stranded-DNA-specific exonuclease RecJ [Actinomycetia bacterium]|nr:single-stranded-DNA-specific exonuclease RecJ [Actinomycetes bacterium]
MPSLWESRAADPLATQKLAERLGIGQLLARILVARGFSDAGIAQDFLDASLAAIDPEAEKIAGMPGAVEALLAAIASRKRIVVFGDFDVDGISATALLHRALLELGADSGYLIPLRTDEGYGLTDAAIERVLEHKPDVLITVDNGIASWREAALLRAAGIEVIVTDHHEPSGLPLEGIPVTDPKLSATGAGQDLSGAGVALMLVKLVGEKLGKPDLWRQLTDLATLGTVADMMNLDPLNRALVRDGMARINTAARPGIAALLASGGQQPGELSANDLSFGIIPKMNAAGRLDQPLLALKLLISDDARQLADTVERLEQINQQRRQLEAEMSAQALEQIEANYHGQKLIIAANDNWHEGVKGIVASRLANKFGVPCLLFSLVGDEARGSGRSVGRINLFAAVAALRDLTLRFGGHQSALGLTVARKDLPEFARRLEANLSELPDDAFHPPIVIDAQVGLNELGYDQVDELKRMEPFGQGNPPPLLASRHLGFEVTRAVGKEANHLSFKAAGSGCHVQAIWFNPPMIDAYLGFKGQADVVYQPISALWRGRRQVEMNVKAVFSCSVEQTVKNILLGNENKLHDSQEKSLNLLKRGRSPLLVMPTGRGKSMVFAMHAARLALEHGQASIFVYPLRALLNDQFRQMEPLFAALGVNCALLYGETGLKRRDQLYCQLEEGNLSVVMTTPEFLLLYARRLSASGRVAFMAVDEAHHIAQDGKDHRPAYRGLSSLRQDFAGLQVLACSATADLQAAEAIRQELQLDSLVVDQAERLNLHLDDQRGHPDKLKAVASLVAASPKSLVFVGSRDQARILARDLRQATPIPEQLAFYHAGLGGDVRRQLAADFQSGQLRCLVSTSAFGEGVNIPDIRDIIVYQPPFSLTALNQLAGRAGRDGHEAFIHLFFDEQDLSAAKGLLSLRCIARDSLACLYRYLLSLNRGSEPMPISDEALALACQRIDENSAPKVQQIGLGLRILADLGLLILNEESGCRQIVLSSKREKVDLNSSSLYLEAQREMEGFEVFSQLLDQAGVQKIEKLIQGPIVPHGAEWD